ncbi:MAG TPA: response regulator [Ferruginibacter sp.]|nr:response regulator [Ferruginibacter sp.]
MKDVHILLVEDNEGDIILTLEAFKSGKLRNDISVVRDGEEAIRFLKKEGEFTDACRPDIILLDINLPKLDGKETLHYIKNDEEFKSIPVVMLTTSSSEKDVQDAYNCHANCYITKPVDFTKFIQVVQFIENFWITIVKLPQNPTPCSVPN